MKKEILNITKRITERSRKSRAQYLENLEKTRAKHPPVSNLSCGNFAHAIAGCNTNDKTIFKKEKNINIAIINSYNDMLSAHKTYESYPTIIREVANLNNATAQVAAGVPAMCDGVTQGQPGMEMSLISRDIIALSTVIGLSHNMFNGAAYLGICDKIVPGMLIGALKFGYLPSIFIPGGPMSTGISNDEKAKIRKDFALSKIGKSDLLKGEMDAYHSKGTCTFYGTANSNQMLMEFMGLHLPGSSFVNPESDLRRSLTENSIEQLLKNIHNNENTLADIINEKSIVNGIIGLLSSGGSTNLVMHVTAIAAAAGIKITLEDFSDLSSLIPLLCKVYPNGKADINDFHENGGIQFLINELLANGSLHNDVNTVVGESLSHYTETPEITNGKLSWKRASFKKYDTSIHRKYNNPFQSNGGLKVLKGNLGESIVKTSSLNKEDRIIKAKAMVFTHKDEFMDAFQKGLLNKDVVVVIKNQGPKANGMPELHYLTPILSILQNRGYKVGLITDGRMSGASGKTNSAIHLSPESIENGPISKIENDDMIEIDSVKGTLNVIVNEKEFNARKPVQTNIENYGMGRELFNNLRSNINYSKDGGSFLNFF